MKDIKKIQEFFSKPLNEDPKQTYQVAVEDFEEVVQKVKSTGHPATIGLDPEFNEIDIIIGMDAPYEISKDIDNAIKSLPSRERLSISGDSSSFGRGRYSKIERVNGGHKDYFEESLNEMEFGDPVDAVFRKYAGKTIEMDFEDMESDWANLLNDLEEYFPGDKLSDFMDSGEADLYLDDYNITLMEPIMDKDVDLDVLKRAKAKMDIDKMRYDAGMPPMDSIASLNEDEDIDFEYRAVLDKFKDIMKGLDVKEADALQQKLKAYFAGLDESLNENELNENKIIANRILRKYGIKPLKTVATAVRGFRQNVGSSQGYAYNRTYPGHAWLSLHGIDSKIIDQIEQEFKEAGLEKLYRSGGSSFTFLNNRDIYEMKEKSFADYTNQELAAYVKNTKDKEAAKELHKRSQKLKDLSRTDVKEDQDINDPVMVRMRAAKDKLAKMRAANAGDDDNDKFFDAAKLRALKSKRAQIMRDMEQEAEPEGGPIANRYGDMLNAVDAEIAKEKAMMGLEENKPAFNVNNHIKAIQIQLQQMGVKYEMSGNPYKPFKAVYKPVNKDDRWYKDFDDIVFRYNLGGVVKTVMNEALMLDKYEVDFFHTKANVYANIEIPSENPTFEDDIQIKGTGKTEEEAFEDLKRNYENYKKTGIREATKDEETTFHKKLDKLVHDTFGKRKGEMEEGELTEAYVPSNIKEFAKRRGISSLVNKVAGWAEKVGARITGGTAIGKGYNTLILDLGYQTADIRIDVEEETIELYDEPIYSFADFKNVFMEEVTRQQMEHDEEQLRRERGLEERIAEALDKINEELCPAGKAYIKKRQAAGEKSSAYLSGRAVKVCKGQMKG